MAFLTGSNQPPLVDLHPIIKSVKVAKKPIQKLLSDGETAIAFTENAVFALGAYYLENFKKVSAAKADEMIGRLPLPAYVGTSSTRECAGKLQCSLQVRKRNGIRERHISCSIETPKDGGPVSSVFCTSRDGTFLYWCLPGVVVIYVLAKRHRQLLARIHLPDMMPTAVASTLGLLLVGDAEGRVWGLSFQPTVAHFILDLESEGLISDHNRCTRHSGK